ncbi:hypothetical protein J9884_18720 [Chromobacterium violaceum]|nr:hypothetical protein [Chromobacterium violaceum]
MRAFGRRIDHVDYHPSRHDLLALYRSQGLVSLLFDSERFGRWTAFLACTARRGGSLASRHHDPGGDPAVEAGAGVVGAVARRRPRLLLCSALAAGRQPQRGGDTALEGQGGQLQQRQQRGGVS